MLAMGKEKFQLKFLELYFCTRSDRNWHQFLLNYINILFFAQEFYFTCTITFFFSVDSVIKNALGNICDIKLNSAWTFLWPCSQEPWSGGVCTGKLS